MKLSNLRSIGKFGSPACPGFDILPTHPFQFWLDLAMNVLILTTDQELALFRQRVLELAGHRVKALSSEKEMLEAAEQQVPFDVALLCHRLPAATARKLIRIFRD